MTYLKRILVFLIVTATLSSVLTLCIFAETAVDVDNMISAIGEVNIHSYKKIQTARSAYDALGEEEKGNVTLLSELIEAENKLSVIYSQVALSDHSIPYNATRFYLNNLGTPSVGSVGGEWMVIALCRDGEKCPVGYYENVVAYVNSKINEKEQLHKSKSTDNSRVILGLTSAGYDVTDVGGHNLLMGLTDMTYLKKQGINGPIWALIAFDCYNYDIPENPDATEQVTREGIIDFILGKQFEDGGWAMSGKNADPDMTGMAIQALSPYYDSNELVKESVDRAIETLSAIQLDNGGFGSVDGSCSESCAQVIVALSSLGIDPENDPRFIKNGVSVVDAMCSFAIEGGGFAHIPNAALNGMATEQGQYALVSYFRFLEDKNNIYDMTDVVIGDFEEIPPPSEDEEENTTTPKEEEETLPNEEENDTDKENEGEVILPDEGNDKSTPPSYDENQEENIPSSKTEANASNSNNKTTASVKKENKPVTSPQTGDVEIGISIVFMLTSSLGILIMKRKRIN